MRKLQTALHTKDANLPSYSIATEASNTREVFAALYFTPDSSDKKLLWMLVHADMDIKTA
jgi:hypothetical protein